MCCIVFWGGGVTVSAVTSAAHSAVSFCVWSCRGQLGSQLRPDNPLYSASNRKQTPLISDSCQWLMILIQFSKAAFFSFASSETFHQFCHGQLAWLLCAGIKDVLGKLAWWVLGWVDYMQKKDWKTSLMSLIRFDSHIIKQHSGKMSAISAMLLRLLA